MKRRIALVMAVLVAVAFMPAMSFAAKTVKMTDYSDVYKSGKTAYCAGDAGLYKVTLKKGKVKKVKRLVKMGEYGWVMSLKKKGKYIYFVEGTNGTVSYICRVKTSGGKAKSLGGGNEMQDYAISGNKIYYSYLDYNDRTDEEYVAYRQMKLNGKGKKKSSVVPRETTKTSNAKGYKVKSVEKGGYVKDYLKTPKGKFYLGKKKLPW